MYYLHDGNFIGKLCCKQHRHLQLVATQTFTIKTFKTASNQTFESGFLSFSGIILVTF